MMVPFLVIGSDGVEVRRGHCQKELLVNQASADRGEVAIAYEPSKNDPETFALEGNGKLIPHCAAPDPGRASVVQWAVDKAALAETLMRGFPSQYGPVDLRDGAKAAMTTAVALNQGISLILLDNSIIALDAGELRTLVSEASAWEQTQVMAAQSLRPAIS